MRPARTPARSVVGSADRASRSWAEELFAVAAAEQEEEAVQVVAQVAETVGGVGPLGLACLAEPDLTAGERVGSGVHLGVPGPAQQLLYVSARGASLA